MKKILLLFTAMLTLGMTAFAQETNLIRCFQDGDWLYAINPDAVHEVTVVHYCGEEGSEATELTIPSYVTYDGSRYFVAALGEYLFSDNSWRSFDKYTQEWKHDTFTKLEKVTIPNSVTTIGGSAFYGCTGLTTVTIGNSVTEIGEGAFYECDGLTSVTIPNSVAEIGENAFALCTGLISVTIGNSVTTIGDFAFFNCNSLASVTIPSSVIEIGYLAFGDCKSLASVTAMPAIPPTISDTFYKVPETGVVYVPKGSFKAYFVADGWSHFADFREMGALDIALSESTISIEEGETATLTVTVTKDDEVTVESETWSTSNPEVATVADGVVTAVGEGTATITCTVVDGYGVPHTESCNVTVSPSTGIENITANGSDAPAEFFNLNGVRVNGNALTPGIYIKRQAGKSAKVLVK